MNTKIMKLKCQIKKGTNNNNYKVISQLFDGTPFDIVADKNLVFPNEELADKDVVDGWLQVEQIGQQHGRCLIILPAASTTHGKNVSVNSVQLLPIHVTASMFIER